MQAGTHLRQARERLGLTFRDVEQASHELAARLTRPEFIIHISRLADIENHGVVPNLHRLFALCTIYHLDFIEALTWYGLPLAEMFRTGGQFPGPRTHPAAPPLRMRIPIRLDPGFDPRWTDDFTRRVESWAYLEPGMMNGKRRYCLAYIGLEDHTMDPLIRPGSLVLVDPERDEVRNSGWTNEFDRPIYFVDARTSYSCAWCLLEGDHLILQSHPLSSTRLRMLRYPEEAEIIGQVVGLAMRLDPA
jgi:transcriptional regulator with XRE-family HTH domain